MTEEELSESFWETDGLADQIYEFLRQHLDLTSVEMMVRKSTSPYLARESWDWE